MATALAYYGLLRVPPQPVTNVESSLCKEFYMFFLA